MDSWKSLPEISVNPVSVQLHIPPIVWKGDSVGHIGVEDTFFWVLEGECYLMVEEEIYIVRPGQLAYLPKGRKRTYTQMSPRFVMYEMAFSVTTGGENLMERLHLTQGDLVVEIAYPEQMNGYFESSCRREMYRDPLYDVIWCGNVLRILEQYLQARQTLSRQNRAQFQPVLRYMQEGLCRRLSTEELANQIPMQPTYFIRKFKAAFGHTPQEYLNWMRLFQAQKLLVTTDWSMERIARRVGVEDASYFSRFFKKYCKTTPREYRSAFRKSPMGEFSADSAQNPPLQPKVDK